MKKNIDLYRIAPAIITSYRYCTSSRSIFKANTTAYSGKLPKNTVEEFWLKISLLFGFNVVYGHKAILSINWENRPCGYLRTY